MESSTLSSEPSSGPSDGCLSLASEPIPRNVDVRKKRKTRQRIHLRKHHKEMPSSNVEGIAPKSGNRCYDDKINITESRVQASVRVNREERKRLVFNLLSHQGLNLRAKNSDERDGDHCKPEDVTVRDGLICDLLKRLHIERTKTNEMKMKVIQTERELELLKSVISKKLVSSVSETGDGIGRENNDTYVQPNYDIDYVKSEECGADKPKTSHCIVDESQMESDVQIHKQLEIEDSLECVSNSYIQNGKESDHKAEVEISGEDNTSYHNRIEGICPTCEEMVIISAGHKSISKASQMDQFYNEWQNHLPNAKEVRLKDGSILIKSKKRPGRWAFKLNLKNL